MYIKRIQLQNYGPIADVKIETRLDVNGNPVPLLLVGSNGAGKSIILSCLLDALVEAKRTAFNDAKEAKPGKYIKVSSKSIISTGSAYLKAQVAFSVDGSEMQFDEVVTTKSIDNLKETHSSLFTEISELNTNQTFIDGGFYKFVKQSPIQRTAVRKQPFLFLPNFRFEIPSWLSPEANVALVSAKGFYGEATANSVQTTFGRELKEWLANLLLDREIYERKLVPLKNFDQVIVPEAFQDFQVFLDYSGPNCSALALVNQVITQILQTKNQDIDSARLGFGTKQGRNISVFASVGGQETLVAHDIVSLSTGQLFVLNMCTQLIKNHEEIKGYLPTNLTEIEGILIVDEIDLSLHVMAQLNLLPKVLRSFPKVQIIATTHSPLFLLGMRESGDTDIYSLPDGKPIQIEGFKEFTDAYNVYLAQNEKYARRLEELESKNYEQGVPVVFCEGKTDVKHFRLALTQLQNLGEYKDVNVNFFDGATAPEGDSQLLNMCRQYSRTLQPRKTIFIFDNDIPKTVEQVTDGVDNSKNWGNNVYSMVLSKPEFRKESTRISVEHLHSNVTLIHKDQDTSKRLFFSNEVQKTVNATTDKCEVIALDQPLTADENSKKVIDKDVDQIKNHKGESVALSKDHFFEKIVSILAAANTIDWTGFKPTLNVLEKIARS